MRVTAGLPRAVFWLTAALLVVLKFVLVSDLRLEIIYGPHDDLLYVERALYLLSGDAFGPYNPRILGKYPGISFWLAGTASLGIPYLASVSAVYIGAGVYVLAGLRAAGVGRAIALAAFALWLFNPVTFGYEWLRVMREPLSTGLLGLMVGAVLHVFVCLDRGRPPWLHVCVFVPIFAFSLYLREDDLLLWGFLILFVGAAFYQLAERDGITRRTLAIAASLALVPAVTAGSYHLWLRNFVEQHYGLPILHDLGEGEFARLLATIRSIDSVKENRMVMVTQEALAKLRTVVPEFAPVIDRLPPPGLGTYSCRMHGVCSEWSNGWMPFWIKEQAFRAGLTNSLPEAQAYFRQVRLRIEQACDSGRLSCTRRGDGLVPPMELRWTRALVAEAWALAKMTLAPDPHLHRADYLFLRAPDGLVRKFEAVTLTQHVESTQAQGGASDSRKDVRTRLRNAIANPYQLFAEILLLIGLATLALRLWVSDRIPLDPLARTVAVFGIYSLARLAILSYISVFMGSLVPRFVFSTYAVSVLLALPFVVNALPAWRRAGR